MPPPAPADRPLAGILLRIGAASCFAAMSAIIKLAQARGVSVWEAWFYRNLFALPLVAGAVWLTAGLGSVRTARPGAHALRTLIGIVSMLLTFQAVALMPLTEATAINFTAPLFATLLSALVLGEAVGPRRWAAVLLGFAGVLLVARPSGGGVSAVALGVGLSAALLVSLVTITIRQLAATERPATVVFWFTLGGTLVSGLAMPFVAQGHDAAGWALLLAIGLLGGAAQFLMTASLGAAPVGTVAPFDYVQIAWAMLWGWLLWGHLPTAAALAGALLIAGSGAWTAIRERRARIRPATPAEAE